MPSTMVSHWDSSGQANGHMSKFWALFIFPFICVFLYLLLIFVPKADPMKKNIAKFVKYYDFFIFVIFLFMLYLYSLTLIWNLGWLFNMTYSLIPAFSVLFYCAGILIAHSKRNWTIGIRTPWTISSDVVWAKTHKLGALLFKASAIISLLSLFVPAYSFFVVVVSVLLSAIVAVVYSYLIYRKN